MSSILVVDDEAAMREFYRRALAAGEHFSIGARTAEEALDFLALTPDIQLVVVDLNMPGHGGQWLIEQMRQRFPDVAVILATADENVAGTLSLQPTIVSYLVKPIAAARLLSAVGQALGSPAPPALSSTVPDAAADPYEAWLNRKLTHRHGDDNDQTS